MTTDLSKIAGNVHLFKLTGALLLENINLRKNWIWDVLEIDWSDVHVTLNGTEINLPISIVIPLVDKLRVRWHFKKNPLHLYIKLKQRKSWFNLENTNQNVKHLSSNIKKLINKTVIIVIFLLVQFFIFRMNKQLNASCNFQNGLLVCELTGNTVEVVLKVKTRSGKHTLTEDRYSRTEKFCPWDRADRRSQNKYQKKKNAQMYIGPKFKRW